MPQTQAKEWGAALALLPSAATVFFYTFPAPIQEQPLVQFVPQVIAYVALGFWALHNHDFVSRLGLEKRNFWDGLRWGLLTGLLLGCLNTFVILIAYPHLGYDITFSRTHCMADFLSSSCSPGSSVASPSLWK